MICFIANNGGFFTTGYIGPGAGFAVGGPAIGLIAAILLALVAPVIWPLWRIVRRRRVGIARFPDRRLVVLGFDGMDFAVARKMIQAGELPNLARIANNGKFMPLETTNPAISPVAWSSFATGVSPGYHRIFDFVRYSRASATLQLSSVSEGNRAGAKQRFPPRNMQKSTPFWHRLAGAGVACTILRVPVTYPPKSFCGNLLAGIHVPDLRGTEGTYTLLTTSPPDIACPDRLRGVIIRMDRTNRRYVARIPGPCDCQGRRMIGKLSFRILKNNRVSVISGSSSFVIEQGRFSGWIPVVFRAGLRKTGGICRLLALEVEPQLRIYVTPFSMPPRRPAMAVSHPAWFSACLDFGCGAFATLGIPEDMTAVRDGILPENHYQELCYVIHDERKRMLLRCLSRQQTGLTVCVFDLPDRISHIFWPQSDDGKDMRAIVDAYRACDRIIGDVFDHTAREKKEAAVAVLSDHGFRGFRRAVNLNAWLRKNGFLCVKDARSTADGLQSVDWERTVAYSFGFAGIYLNQPAADEKKQAVKTSIKTGLEALRDSETGQCPIEEVYDADVLYKGPYVADGPSLVVGFCAGYRCAWESAVGRADGPVFRTNESPWRGDHSVDPRHVPGIFGCSDPEMGAVSRIGISQVAARILAFFGVGIPKTMDSCEEGQ